jgi:hypothetical protein
MSSVNFKLFLPFTGRAPIRYQVQPMFFEGFTRDQM